MNNIIKGESFADVYHDAMDLVLNNYDYESSPRKQKIRECLNVTLEIADPTQNLFTNTHRDLPLKYLKAELILYLSGRNDLAGFEKASSFWKSIANKDGTVNSAYGYLIWNCYDIHDNPNQSEYISTQFDWAHRSLIEDKDSRQAIIHYNKPSHQCAGVKDFPCTLNNAFSIRDNRLHMTTMMRSNDMRRGIQFDVPFFTLIQYLMYLKLKRGPYTTLEMGSYTHIANSLHIYEDDFDMIEQMLTGETSSASMPMPQSADVIMSSDIIKMSYGKKMTDHEFNMLNLSDDHYSPSSYEFIKWLNDKG